MSLRVQESKDMTKKIRIVGRIVDFCRFVRAQGLPVGTQETIDALQVAGLGIVTDRRRFKLALRALLCTSREERDRFDALFDVYWHPTPRRPRRGRHAPGAPVARGQHAVPLLALGAAAKKAVADEEQERTSGASTLERLRKTDFSRVPVQDQERLEQLARQLWKQMSRRLTRRLKATHTGRQVHLRRTIRRSISYGGDPIALCYRNRKKHKPRLVVLLDVSGSMDPYSVYLLRFIHALQQHFERVESFLFSTRLMRITDVMKARRLPDSLKALTAEADAWSSGTRIGACLQDFNITFAPRVLSRDARVVILSDGLDTGTPDLLDRELRTLKRRARKLIWLNPLSGMEGYEPLTRGIQAVLPHVDVFTSAHNLESLLRLEAHLIDV